MSLLEKYYTEEHQIFREAARRFFQKELAPQSDEWEEKRPVPREVWKKFAEQGFLCPWVPEEYGGVGSRLPLFCNLDGGSRQDRLYELPLCTPFRCSSSSYLSLWQ